MTRDADELSFELSVHPRGFWLSVILQVAGSDDLQLVIDTGSPVSSLSEGVLSALLADGLLTPTGESYAASPIYRLSRLSVEGQAFPDTDVHRGNRATLLRIDGVLGLDFLYKFGRISFETDKMRLTLTP